MCIATGIVDVCVQTMFMSTLLRAKYKQGVAMAALFCIGLALAIYNSMATTVFPSLLQSPESLFWDGVINFSVDCIYIAAVTLLFDGGFWHKIILYINMYIMALASSLLMNIVLKFFTAGQPIATSGIAVLMPVYYILCTMSNALLLIISAALWKKSGGSEMKNADERGFAILIIAQLLMMLLIAFLCIGSENRAYAFLAAGFAYALCVYADIRAFRLFSRMIKASVIEKQNEELERRQELQQLYYMELNEHNRRQARLAHDFKNHMAAIAGLLERGETGRAEKYVRELSESGVDNAAVRIFDTGNTAADAVLGIKCAQAEKLGAETDMIISFPPCMSMIRDADLMSVIANLIDNAAEGCILADESAAKRIVLRSSLCSDVFMLTCTNPCRDDIAINDKGLPKTNKANAAQHGSGCGIVRAIARKYGGDATFTSADGLFTARVFFNCAQSPENRPQRTHDIV